MKQSSHNTKNHIRQEIFSQEAVSCFLYFKFPSCLCSKTMIVTPVLGSDLVDRFQQYLHIQVGIHPLRQRHCTGVAYDLFDHGRIHLSLRQH